MPGKELGAHLLGGVEHQAGSYTEAGVQISYIFHLRPLHSKHCKSRKEEPHTSWRNSTGTCLRWEPGVLGTHGSRFAGLCLHFTQLRIVSGNNPSASLHLLRTRVQSIRSWQQQGPSSFIRENPGQRHLWVERRLQFLMLPCLQGEGWPFSDEEREGMAGQNQRIT